VEGGRKKKREKEKGEDLLQLAACLYPPF